jgi:hypothetical protein
MMIKIASCFVLACSMVLGGCVGDATDVDATQGDDALAPQADANGVWTKVSEGVWERTRPSDAVEHFVVGASGMSWLSQQQRQQIDAFQKEAVAADGEEISAERQKSLDVLQANLAATEKAVAKLSSTDSDEVREPGAHPEYFTSSAGLGSCSDFLVAGPTSVLGANAAANIDSFCPIFYISAYATVNGVGGSIGSSSYRGVSASIGGTGNCISQAYAQANGWGHTLTYPYCN